MKIIYPKKYGEVNDWTKTPLAGLPCKDGGDSGFLLIAVAQHGIDLYALFTDPRTGEVFIEKTTTLNPHASHLAFEILERIEDVREYTRVHQFFIDKGFLCGIKKE